MRALDGIQNGNISYDQRSHHERIQKTSLTTKLICGAIAGVIGTTIIFPLDIVKTRLQGQRSNNPVKYNGVFNCFRHIIKYEGFRGLYQGLGPNLVGISPEKAIKLAVNDQMRERLAVLHNQHPDELDLRYGMMAGATAGFCQVIATNPMEIVKIQLQLAGANRSQGQVRSTGWEVAKSLGLRGLYKGTVATLMRDVPFSIVFFPSVALFKNIFNTNQKEATFPVIFGSGVIAGAIAAAAVTPMDVIKTRLQITPRAGDPIYKGIVHCYSETIKNEGFGALFKGVVPRMMIVSPLFAITVLVYEIFNRFIRDKK